MRFMKFMGFISANADDIFFPIFQGLLGKVVKIKMFMRLIFRNKQNWICFGVYFREFDQNLQNL